MKSKIETLEITYINIDFFVKYSKLELIPPEKVKIELKCSHIAFSDEKIIDEF